jgi:hypothetical protein
MAQSLAEWHCILHAACASSPLLFLPPPPHTHTQAVLKMGPSTTASTTMTVPGPQLGSDLFRSLGDDFAAGLLSGLGPVFVGSLMRAAGPAAAGGFLRGMGPACECLVTLQACCAAYMQNSCSHVRCLQAKQTCHAGTVIE